MSLDGSDRCVYIITLLSEKEKAQLHQVIQFNADVFAWTHADMPRISPIHASHKLNVAPSAKSVRQKVRRFHPDRHLVIQTEVDNLLHNGFIRVVKYPEWLANVVAVLKKRNKWRVCVDYTDLNDDCPKDSFPLPRIDHIIDASAGHVCYHSWTLSHDTTRSPYTLRMPKKRLSSLPRDSTITT